MRAPSTSGPSARSSRSAARRSSRVRDNVVRWAARDTHPPALAAATVSLLAAFAVIVCYLLVARRRRAARCDSAARSRPSPPPESSLGLAYDSLLEAFDHGRVSIVAPLNATQSLWAVLFSALVLGRHGEVIGRRLVAAGGLVVAGGALIGAVR